MTRASFTEVTGALSRAAVPTRELFGPGHIAVPLGAGRIVTLAFTKDGPNLLWSNPQISDTDLVRNQPEKLVGGLGGDRLWFAPELNYHWKGVPDWVTVANYEVPISVDPGAYRFNDVPSGSIALHNSGQLLNRSNDERIGFDVMRTIRLAPYPLADEHTLRHTTDYTGIETAHVMQFDPDTTAGRLDLWHLLQMPEVQYGLFRSKSKRRMRQKLACPMRYQEDGSRSPTGSCGGTEELLRRRSGCQPAR